MSMTISQLAAELSVSREAVRLQVHKLPASDIEKGKNRTTIITDSGADIIREWFRDAPNSNNNTTSSNADKSDDNSKNQTTICESCEALQQQVTNLQQSVTSIGNDLEAKIRQIQLLSDNIADLRATVERQAAELQAKIAEAERKDTQIADLHQTLRSQNETIQAQNQTIQAQQIINSRVLQLEAPKRKWYDVFRKRGNSEPT